MTDVRGYEDRYAVTEQGEVWSYPKIWISSNGAINSHDGKWLKAFLIGSKNKQYYAVQLGKKTYRVHVLVAQTFIPNPDKLPYVNHIDGNRFNNALSNLEWITHQNNLKHAQAIGLNHQFYGEDHGRHRLTAEEVQRIRDEREKGATLKTLSEMFNSCISNISYICRGETRLNG